MSATIFTPSPEQQMVIDHRCGHLQVVACAGAGKTEAISRRMASLTTRITNKVVDSKDNDSLDRLRPTFILNILLK